MEMDRARLTGSVVEQMNKTVQEQCAKLGIGVKTSTVPVLDKDGHPVMGGDGKPLVRITNVMSSITDGARELLEVFNERTPCWFKGCESLRRQYNEERSAQDCSGCSGKTMRKYMALARKLLDADPDRKVPRLH